MLNNVSALSDDNHAGLHLLTLLVEDLKQIPSSNAKWDPELAIKVESWQNLAQACLQAFSSSVLPANGAALEDNLTVREREMLILIARGMQIKQIAHMQGVSEKTVRNHLASIYHKLAMHDRVQLVIYAVKKGLVDIHSL